MSATTTAERSAGSIPASSHNRGWNPSSLSPATRCLARRIKRVRLGQRQSIERGRSLSARLRMWVPRGLEVNLRSARGLVSCKRRSARAARRGRRPRLPLDLDARARGRRRASVSLIPARTAASEPSTSIFARSSRSRPAASAQASYVAEPRSASRLSTRLAKPSDDGRDVPTRAASCRAAQVTTERSQTNTRSTQSW